MKTITAWTVKTRTGIIIPSWIFDSKEEAEEHLESIKELFRTHKHYVFEVEITVKDETD